MRMLRPQTTHYPNNPSSLARLFIPLAIFLHDARMARAVNYTQLEPTGSIGDPNYPVSGAYIAFGINDAGLVVGTNNYNGILWNGSAMLGMRVVDAVNGVRYSQAGGIANSAGGNTL